MNKTKIEWTNATWNPVTGCTPISIGCENCYARSIANRFWGNRKFSDIRFHPERLEQPLKWKIPQRIFVCSISDLFHENVSFFQIDSVFNTIIECQDTGKEHTFILLTKRPKRMKAYLEDTGHWTLPNIWCGVTAENKEMADKRIPTLLQIPASVRFVSIEPMLSVLDLSNFLGYNANKGESSYGQRKNFIQVSTNRGMENRQDGENMEHQEQPIQTNRASTSTWISSSKKNDQWSKDTHRSTQVSISSFQRGNTKWIDDKSQKRNKSGQPSGQLGSNDIFRKSKTCFHDGVSKSEQPEKSSMQINESTSNRNQESICNRRNYSKKTCRGIQCNIPDDIENSQRGSTSNIERSDRKLSTQKKQWTTKKKPKGSIHLIICGSESGPKRRPAKMEWIKDLRDQCIEADVPFFCKQAEINGKLVKMPEINGKVWDQVPG